MLKCKQCGDCCIAKTVTLTSEDIKRMEKLTKEKFYRTRRAGSKILNWKPYNDTYVCLFFNTDKYQCSIYKNRPYICKKLYCSKAFAKEVMGSV